MNDITVPTASLKGVSVRYGPVRALEQVDLELAPGAITGLIGPNGAGKTSLMRAMAGLQDIDDGQIMINGIDLRRSAQQAQQQIGYVADHFGVFQDLTITQALRYRALCHRMPAEDIPARIDWAIQALDLMPLLNRKGGELSRGQRQRLAIAQAIIVQPSLLVLDEPASGLDPDARAHLSETFVMLAKLGMTLLVSSHILAELADYATDIAILQAGRLVERTEIRNYASPQAQCRIMLAHAVDAAQLNPVLNAIPGLVLRAQPDPASLIIDDPGDLAAHADMLRRLVAAGVPVAQWMPVQQHHDTNALIDMYRRHIPGGRNAPDHQS